MRVPFFFFLVLCHVTHAATWDQYSGDAAHRNAHSALAQFPRSLGWQSAATEPELYFSSVPSDVIGSTSYSALATLDGTLKLVSTADNTLAWKVQESAGILGHPSFDAALNSVIYGTFDRRVVGRALQTGALQWEAQLPSALAYPLLVIGEQAYGLGISGQWSSVNTADGSLSNGAVLPEPSVHAAPCACGGRLVAAGERGLLAGYSTGAGMPQVWSWRLTRPARGLMCNSTGMLYVLQSDGTLLAFDGAGGGPPSWSMSLGAGANVGMALASEAPDHLVVGLDNGTVKLVEHTAATS